MRWVSRGFAIAQFASAAEAAYAVRSSPPRVGVPLLESTFPS
jgi:hypothetical protein